MFRPGNRVWHPISIQMATVINDDGQMCRLVFDRKPDKVAYVATRTLQLKERLADAQRVDSDDVDVTLESIRQVSKARDAAAYYDCGLGQSSIALIQGYATQALEYLNLGEPEIAGEFVDRIHQTCFHYTQFAQLPGVIDHTTPAQPATLDSTTTPSADNETQGD